MLSVNGPWALVIVLWLGPLIWRLWLNGRGNCFRMIPNLQMENICMWDILVAFMKYLINFGSYQLGSLLYHIQGQIHHHCHCMANAASNTYSSHVFYYHTHTTHIRRHTHTHTHISNINYAAAGSGFRNHCFLDLLSQSLTQTRWMLAFSILRNLGTSSIPCPHFPFWEIQQPAASLLPGSSCHFSEGRSAASPGRQSNV